MRFHYQLTGVVEVPDGTRLSDAETAIILPDGTIIKLWEAWEQHHPDKDEYRNLSDAQLTALEIYYDTHTHAFEVA
ncbi:hypothetical protein [Novosphingobium sp. ES2-1]|uniref:hypothetical protein n=1 Tax=Novosphingobium sp. ES2-1 TaxID=2780074 RepID=UPI00187ECAC7|nr:hypothetical protein [Novosphingobium sp. ES2-1]QOV96514.1 hypothetical protein IM701_19875 [Novosphingobium sp. ES2-1]